MGNCQHLDTEPIVKKPWLAEIHNKNKKVPNKEEVSEIVKPIIKKRSTDLRLEKIKELLEIPQI